MEVARSGRGVPRPHRAARQEDRRLLAGGCRLCPAGRRRHRRQGRGRPGGGAARWRAGRAQGHLRDPRPGDHGRLEDPEGLHSALRIDGVGALGRRRRDSPGQDQHGRVRHGLVEREQRLLPRAQPLGSRARPRGLVGRLGRGGRGVAVRRGPRHRHRWLDSPAGVALRGGRREADLRPGLPLRRDRFRLVPRPSRPVRPHGRGRGRAARGHRRARPDGRHLDSAAGRPLPPGLQGWDCGHEAGRARRVLSVRHGPGGRGGRAARARRAGPRGGHAGPRLAAAHASTRSRPTT